MIDKQALYVLRCDHTGCEEVWAGGTALERAVEDAVTSGAWRTAKRSCCGQTFHYCPEHALEIR